MIINPYTPVFNTIIFYILIVCLILIVKPKFMYCHKSNRFRQFGFGKGQTLLAFPSVCVGSGILLYLFFIMIEVVCLMLDKK